MTHHFGDAIVTVECPDCGARMRRTVANLRLHARMRCSDCCSTISVDGEQLKDALDRFAVAYHAAWTNQLVEELHVGDHCVESDATSQRYPAGRSRYR